MQFDEPEPGRLYPAKYSCHGEKNEGKHVTGFAKYGPLDLRTREMAKQIGK